MALHSTVFKHNILRVSKLRKLTHTTQVYERRFEKNAHECCSLPDLREVSFEQSKDSSIDSLQEEKHTVTHVPVLERHAAQLNAYVMPLHDARSQLMCIQKTLPLFPILDETLRNDREDLSLPFSVIEQLSVDNIVARPITYTWDDIILHPVNGSSMHNLDAVLFSNDADSLPEQHTDTKIAPKTPCAATRYCNFDSCKAHTSQDFGREALVLDSCGTDIVKKFSEVTLYLYSNSAKIQGQSVGGGTSSRKPLNERPNMDQLKAAEKYFLETEFHNDMRKKRIFLLKTLKLPMFFKKSLDYRMYHPNVIFENNFWGRNEIFTGIKQYAMQMAKLRVLAHFRYVNIQLEVISSVCLEEECAVQVQWRIMGLSQFKALKFWRYSFWSYRNSFRKDAEWLEGISTFFINNEGFIIKHQLDRMRPDEEQLQKSVSLSAKLAVLLGLSSPKPGLTDFTSLFFHRQMLQK